MGETGEEEAVERRNDMMQSLNGRVSSTERTGEQHPSDVAAFSPRPDGADADGDGVLPGPSPGRDNQSSSLDSSVASSPLYSGRHYSELEDGGRLPRSEIEEIPSARWLPHSLLPRPASSAADSWGQLVGRDTVPANALLRKVVIRVQMENAKQRAKAMEKAVGIEGVMSVAIDGVDKNRIVVIGDGVDAVALVIKLRKHLRFAELISFSAVGG